MLEGLEIKELFLSELKTDNEKLRLDDEFFLKKFIDAYVTIKRKPHVLFDNIIDVLTDYHANGSYETLNQHVKIMSESDYAYMIRSTDLEQSDFKTDVRYISESAYNYLSKTKLEGGEILINKIGNPGRVYIMPKLNRPSTLGMNLFMIRLKSKSGFKERFVWAFFNSELGQRIIYRKINGTVPLTIDKSAIRTLYISKLSENYQALIEKVILNSEIFLFKAKSVYSYAENLLLDVLGLVDFFPSEEKVNIKSFKDSFCTTGRLDAEYYQHKYEELIEVVKNYKEGANVLENFVDSYSTGFPFQSETYAKDGVYFIRINNVQRGNLDLSDAIKVPFTDAATLSPKNIAKENDILISMSGTIGNSCKIPKGVEAVINQRIFRFTPKNYDPEVLSLIINSIIGLHQLNRIGTGGVQTNISSSDILKIQIPSLSLTAQSQISSLIEKSFALKAESERLLNVAKRAVEIAIEQDEESATKWIQEQAQH